MDILTILIFCIILVSCIAAGIPIEYALFAGLILFLIYGMRKGHSLKKLLLASWSGVRKVGNIIVVMLIIGVLTAFWRASGCIPTIVCYASGLIHPSFILLTSFLLNALVSYLTGTSFGAVATMGVICANIAYSLNVSPIWAGGAIMSGVFFGDRCSPLSSSCLLVCTVTETDVYDMIKAMLRSQAVPFVLSCIIYLVAGLLLAGNQAPTDVVGLFREGFQITWICLLPAIIVLALTIIFHMDVKLVMAVSIAVAASIACFVQGMAPGALLQTTVFGFRTSHEALAPMINGGGLTSMVQVCVVVCIASCYSGIFELTGLLNFLRDFATKLAAKQSNFRAVFVVSLTTCMIACSQALAILLTNQLSADIPMKKEERALYIEDTVILMAALIPWSVACMVPLATIAAPTSALLCACYLYLIPVWDFIVHNHKRG